MDGPDQPVGARREAPCRCLPQASDAGSGKGLGGDCLRKDEVWHEEDRENCKPIPALIRIPMVRRPAMRPSCGGTDLAP